MRTRFVVTQGWFMSFCLAFSIATAMAQSGRRPDPADPGAAALAPKYESPFAEYQPFRDEKIRSWQEVNKEVADNPSMGSMKHTPGMTMPGMEAKAGEAPSSKGAAAGHNMDAMKGMPGKPMPGMDKQAATASQGKEGATGHDMGAMKGMPGKPMPGMNEPAASAPMSKDGLGAMAMVKPQTAPGQPVKTQTAEVTGTGVVQSIDKANGKVKLTHDPISSMGWPRMTLFLRLKNSALVNEVKEGDKVEFSLEKSASGYVISGLRKPGAGHDMKHMK